MEAQIMGAIVGGIIVGLVPLILGLKLKQNNMAIGSFIATIIGGFILGIFLSIPICIVTSIIIISKSDQSQKLPYQQTQNSYSNQTSNFCRNCGNQLNTDSQFCPKCGSKVS